MSLIQNDPENLMAYADGLCRYLHISGFKEVSAVDKLISLISISDG